MTEQTETGATALDTVKLAAAAAILVGGIAAFYWLVDVPVWVRWLIVFAALGVGAFVALQSVQGRNFWQFVQGSRIELRKVVWPTREQATNLTVLVCVASLAVGLFLGGLDLLFAQLFKMLLGQG